ncbi:hypothetical protein LC653_40270 [Nostoc sp. CHAB 5784]|uniref:hypothetical protein n=1 Tax=Nostoc mirabile TaxID=2907820 RepID=UPI001E4EC160|nr:hypothetical protein [Nostoc mirabile]MCC5669880.1 hypothetical protein [Nostoc mirabile CHAB5784]
MAEPTLVQVFGTGAVQDSTSLTIQKSALATTGLTVSANNTAESLVVSLLLLAATYLNPTNQESNNSDIQVTIADSEFPSIVFRNSANYRQITYNVNLQKPDTGSGIDPDDY